MKKQLSFLLALCMLFAFCLPMASCARGDAPQDETTTQSASEETLPPLDPYGRPILPSSVPDDLRFGGETVTILLRDASSVMNTSLEFISEGLTSEPVNDAVYTRNKEVEDQLNVKLQMETVTDVSYETYYNTVRKCFLAGDGAYDLLAYYAYYGVMMATEGMLVNYRTLDTVDLSKPWWNQDFVNEMELCGQLYFNVGDLSLSSTALTNAVFFNKKLMEERFGDTDLYSVVQNGDWTIDRFSSMIADCYTDANGNGKRDADDFYGAELTAVSIPMDAYILALGCSITEKDGDGIPQINFGSEHAINAFNKLFDMIHKNEGSLFGPCDMFYYEEAQKKFMANETLFLMDIFVATDHLREMTVDYGVVPIFKYDKQQAAYNTTVADSFSLLSILSVTKVLPQADAVLELMAEKSYLTVTPAYFEISLKQKYSQSNMDAQMFDLILSGRRFNFGFVYSCALNNPTHLWRMIVQSKANTFSSSLKSNNRSWKKALENLVEKYAKMADS